MKYLEQLWTYLTDDSYFLEFVGLVERLVAKVLALAMVIVILVAMVDLGVYLCLHTFDNLDSRPIFSIIKTFGLFLNILVAIEILQNITAYLRNHAIQLELVIVTSLTAVARKIIIYDSKETGADLTGLALASLALAISYWIIKNMHRDP
jgi:uncharacterized membrane protein (DUF373 family)